MAKLIINDRPILNEEQMMIRAKRFLSQSPEIRAKHGLALIYITQKIRNYRGITEKKVIIRNTINKSDGYTG